MDRLVASTVYLFCARCSDLIAEQSTVTANRTVVCGQVSARIHKYHWILAALCARALCTTSLLRLITTQTRALLVPPPLQLRCSYFHLTHGIVLYTERLDQSSSPRPLKKQPGSTFILVSVSLLLKISDPQAIFKIVITCCDVNVQLTIILDLEKQCIFEKTPRLGDLVNCT